MSRLRRSRQLMRGLASAPNPRLIHASPQASLSNDPEPPRAVYPPLSLNLLASSTCFVVSPGAGPSASSSAAALIQVKAVKKAVDHRSEKDAHDHQEHDAGKKGVE